MIRARTSFLLLIMLLMVSTSAGARQKTDLVFIGKADRVTGEITQMSRGILTLSTDNIGTLNIEWEDVDSLSSVYHFRVEDRFGRKYFGALFMTKELELQVIHDGQTQTMLAANVTSITPLETSFWQRLDGSISIGFSYTKASEVAQVTSDFNVRYRSPLRLVVLDASSIATSQDEETTRREDLSITYNRLFPGRWFALAGTGAQTNDELGLDLRVALTAGAGLNLFKTNRNEMVSTTGLSVNREWSNDSDGQYNLEAFLSLEHYVFRYDYPKTDMSLEGTVYPNLTTWGRVRTEVDISISRELISDLTLIVSFYDSFDSDPLSADAEKNDYGIVTSIGWTF